MNKILGRLTPVGSAANAVTRIMLSAAILALGATLSSPAPVRALDVQFTSLPSSGNLGHPYAFTVQVDLRGAEIAPIKQIDLEMYNVRDLSKKATCARMPVSNPGPRAYLATETGGGDVMAQVTEVRLSYIYGSRSVFWETTNTTYSFGEGYGYADDSLRPSITYAILWDPPPTFPTGAYKADVRITLEDSTVLTRTSGQFTLSPAPGGAVFPGTVIGSGEFTENLTVVSPDYLCQLLIPKGTFGLVNSVPISQIKLAVRTTPPAQPAEGQIVGSTYEITPEGAYFSPPVTMTFKYYPYFLPHGFDESKLVLGWWNGTEWVTVEGTKLDLETHNITAPIAHFSVFAVLAYTHPARLTFSQLSISPANAGIGERVTISVVVTNTGDVTGTTPATLRINGAEVSTQNVTLTGGSSRRVMFYTARAEAGTFKVEVGGQTGSFVVQQPPPTTTTPTPTPTAMPPATMPPAPESSTPTWWLIAGFCVGALLLGSIAWQLTRRVPR